MKLSVRDNWVEGDGIGFQGAHAVLEAVLIQNRVLVTYDWMAFERGVAARNLFCYDKAGALLWRAGDIGMGATDAYTGVQKEAPLWVGNFAGYSCRIDETSGAVVETCFTK
jgi:hypothetical protein